MSKAKKITEAPQIQSTGFESSFSAGAAETPLNETGADVSGTEEGSENTEGTKPE